MSAILLINEGTPNEYAVTIDDTTLRTMALVLRSTDHPLRRVRTSENDPRNIPYNYLNRIGDRIAYELGLDDNESDEHD